jgi:hypothetical protein
VDMPLLPQGRAESTCSKVKLALAHAVGTARFEDPLPPPLKDISRAPLSLPRQVLSSAEMLLGDFVEQLQSEITYMVSRPPPEPDLQSSAARELAKLMVADIA